jgi:hypothetical protein
MIAAPEKYDFRGGHFLGPGIFVSPHRKQIGPQKPNKRAFLFNGLSFNGQIPFKMTVIEVQLA